MKEILIPFYIIIYILNIFLALCLAICIINLLCCTTAHFLYWLITL